MNERYLSAKSVKQQFDITRQTLWNWEQEGLIDPGKTPGGQRRYAESSIKRLLGVDDGPSRESLRLRQVADEVAECLMDQYENIIEKIMLYGSVARGEAHAESDIDLVIIVSDQQNSSRFWRRKFHRLVAELKARHGVSVSMQVFNRDTWSNMSDHPFRIEVESKDGVRLVDRAA